MVKLLINASHAGWRAGMAGAHYLDCPLTGWLARACWSGGWEIGMKNNLTLWLKSRKG